MLLWLIGGAVAAIGTAILSSDDDSGPDFESVEREVKLHEEKEREHRIESARKKNAEEREERRRHEAREDFESLAVTKLREFKMKTKLSGNFHLISGECGFLDFATDIKTLSEKVGKAIEARLKPMRVERDDYSSKIKELRQILLLLKSLEA